MLRAFRSLRVLRRHWKLTAIALFSLSIAMALGVVSLSVANTFVLTPPAAAEPDRLVMIYTRADASAVDQVSAPDYLYYRKNNHVFSDVAAAPNSIGLLVEQNYKGQPISVIARPVSDNYFSVMGIHPFLGRLLTTGDDARDRQIAVMTWQCWQRLGADPNMIGKTIAKYTVVGIAPKEFKGSFYGLDGDLLVPLGPDYMTERPHQREARNLFLLARLRPGTGRQQAQAEMTSLSAQLAAAYPKEDGKRTAVVTRATLLSPDGMHAAEIASGILLAVVLLVLLIACANVANLLLAIAVGRRQEASIKLALGAPRGRLIREFLKESALLCAASGAIGYSIAAALIARYPSVTVTMPGFGAFSVGLSLRLDTTVAAFTGALVLIAICATGVSPALYASSPHLAQVLSGEIVVGGMRKNFRRSALVVMQVAICTVVLIGMGLCQRSLYNLRHVDPGFSSRNLVSAPVYLKSEGYTEVTGKEFYRMLRTRVSALPGVEAVTLVSDLPLMGGRRESVEHTGGRKLSAAHTIVDADYFATMGIRLLSGRVFNGADGTDRPHVAVINHRMAEMLWPGHDPQGRQVTVGEPAQQFTVIGVVADGKYEELDEAPQPFMYYALSQFYLEQVHVIARTKGDPRLWLAPLAGALQSLKLTFPPAPSTFESWMNLILFSERLTAACVAGLSTLGLLLAVIGLFGAISYSVSERKKELGIRVALGARSPQLMGMVLRQTLRITGMGVVIGILLGVGAGMVVRSQLYQIAAVEWTVLLMVGAAMLAISSIVAYFSARPWLEVIPMEAVRHA